MSKFALLFLGVFVMCVIAAIFYNGAAAFILYQITYFVDPQHRWWGHQLPGISYSFFASVLMLIVLLKNYKKLSAESPWRVNPALMWLLALLGCYYLAFIWALVPYYQHKFTFDFMKLVVVIFVAYKLIDTKKAFDFSLLAYLFGCTYIGYLATITGRNAGDRVEGISLPSTGGDVNTVAAALVPAGVLLLYFAWMGNKKVRLLCLLCGALVANGLILFNSRGAFLGTVASAGLYLMAMMFSRHRQPGQRGMAIFIILLALGGVIHLTDKLFWQRMATLENPHSKDSGRTRIQFWFASLKMMEEHPLGLGIRGFNLLSPLYLSDRQRGGVEFKSVHSMWFQGLTEVGWHGMLIFLAMLFSLYKLSRRARQALLKESDYPAYFKILALECGFFGFLITGSFINEFRAEILYWMVMFVAVAGKLYYLQPMQEKETERKLEIKRRRIGNLKRLA